MSWLKLKQFWPLGLLLILSVAFFWQFFFKGLLPIPSDTIVGMYHPWRDVIWDDLTNGVPFKNFLITDPVRQQYPWRFLGIELLKTGQLPLWNPYTHAGMPLMANLQSAVFYPLNFLLLILPFNWGWSFLVFLQPFLAEVLMFFYLRVIKLSNLAAFLGAMVFGLSGFSMAWLEWGTILHAALWLPLVLLAIEKLTQIRERKKSFLWGVVFCLGLTFSFLAGHLQTSFYLILMAGIYAVWRGISITKKDQKRFLFTLLISFLAFLAITAFQWLPTLKLIGLSARGIDLDWQAPGWFIPWRHLLQFLTPDFFGNPTTLNYWGEWNYGEFIGYVGVIPLVLAGFGFFSQLGLKAKKRSLALFFGLTGLVFLSLALPTPWAKLPYQLKVPFLATSQPTRLLFLVDFCLAVLAAVGLEKLIGLFQGKTGWRPLIITAGLFLLGYGGLWVLVNSAYRWFPGADWLINLPVAGRNLFLPTALFLTLIGLVVLSWLGVKLLRRRLRLVKLFGLIVAWLLLFLTVFDLFRFGWKFNPFVKEAWLFPGTKTIEFLQADPEVFRVMSTDRRILPPNFSMVYGLQTVDGYDPLYLQRYGELVAASERGQPDISPPFGFNRIITPQRYDSKIINLLNVKYVLSLSNLDAPNLELVFQEGQTRVYENQAVFPRAWLVYDYQLVEDNQEAIDLLFGNFDFSQTVVLETDPELNLTQGSGQAMVRSYQPNKVVVETESDVPGLLVLADAFYPGWQAMVDHQLTEIYRADYHFRAIMVPEGKHLVEFKYGY